MPGLERKLKAEISGDVLFSSFDRGRYATDASHYQMMPAGVVVPKTMDEAERAIRDLGLRGLFVDCGRGSKLIDAPEARPTAVPSETAMVALGASSVALRGARVKAVPSKDRRTRRWPPGWNGSFTSCLSCSARKGIIRWKSSGSRPAPAFR